MLKKLTTGIALGALALSTPLAAQEAGAASEEVGDESMDAIAAMLGGLFQSEPLTEEQEARLPAATAVVSTMMPEGFYGEMMGGMMDKMMRPMMAMFSEPSFILSTRLAVDEETVGALGEDEQAEVLSMLDPAWDRRTDAILGVVLGNMGDLFVAMEPPMREGLSKAYAVRFDESQLADISTFFQTPTGEVYARESMVLMADPQVMSATMQALPQMMGSFTNMEGAIEQAMAELPAERGYEDLSSTERRRLAELLGISAEEVEGAVISPKAGDAFGTEEEAFDGDAGLIEE
ncbi:DUF2059 domain-containing protein [Pontixanthobacter aestiaquae]|uniref:DUF2059 domain-containing protein n=1 Tax=Pontixanthobacter aestiaquae TaxID=1509367 RepID=A0A844YZT6_9SPHN|nr:DUF2059 domain-containing protein [Pontixanthobacter aestiaquae]MDN3647031.1 DUF2059 domain-containing protein [Pontixanthobacter aestiaquae]MXO81991.1 DUF2059 domain-containing protein [Pontixanthobacter aestiaquae]